jgi:hypothetical protein
MKLPISFYQKEMVAEVRKNLLGKYSLLIMSRAIENLFLELS